MNEHRPPYMLSPGLRVEQPTSIRPSNLLPQAPKSMSAASMFASLRVRVLNSQLSRLSHSAALVNRRPPVAVKGEFNAAATHDLRPTPHPQNLASRQDGATS